MARVKPSVVIASGDLTDARKVGLESEQIKEEWEMYRDVLNRTKVREMTEWLDLRGNHDNFNVPGRVSSLNYFNNYSVQGHKHKASYLHQVEKGGSRFSFLAVDATLELGLKRPFNFVGLLTKKEMDDIQRLVDQSRQLKSDHILWFGHYPTSCIVTPETVETIRSAIASAPESVVYMCGHLHTLVNQMYTLHQGSFLELELGDWKDHRMFRIGVMDHGLFSFMDYDHGKWPLVIVTNPKKAQFHIPRRENRMTSLNSSHIRILAFSNGKIVVCKARVDNSDFQPCEQKTDNLFVVKWNPIPYQSDLHSVEVIVEDEFGQKESIVQYFSFDDSSKSPKFRVLARFILMSDFCTNFLAMFISGIVLCVLPLITFRIWHELVIRNRSRRPRFKTDSCSKRCVRKIWLLTTVNRVFWPMILLYVYLIAGPWSFGEVIDGYTSWVFVWGIFVNNSFYPGSLSYAYGFLQLMFCQLPLTIIYANMIDRIYRNRINGTEVPAKPVTKLRFIWNHLPFLLIITVELVLAVLYLKSYNFWSFIICPLRTWSMILHVYIFCQLLKLPAASLDQGFSVWSSSETKSSNGN